MAHPYASHKEVHAGRRVAKSRYGHHAAGGIAHSDAAEDRAMIKKAFKIHDKQMAGVHGGKHTDLSALGSKSGGRLDKYARGGRATHKKGSNIHIAVVAPHSGAGVPPAPVGPIPGPGLPPGPPVTGGGPPVPMKPPLPMMKRGGVIKRALGGRLGMTAGAETGKGRLQKAKIYRKRGQ